MKSDNLELIDKITKYTLRLGYCPIFTFRNNLTKKEDILLMVFNDNICLVADINKLRTILKKNISNNLEVKWYIDENELLYVVVSSNVNKDLCT